MSPVSRTRKPKKSKQKGPARSVARPNRTHTRPDWFDAAVGNVIEGAPVLMEARGPRELEQATAELLGAELAFRIEHENQGLNFHGLSEDIVDAATARIKKSAAAQDDGWEVPLRLLHGLNSLGTPALEAATRAGLRGAAKWLRHVPAARQTPKWLTQRVKATGEVWEMRDTYGLRIAVIAGFAYPEATDPSVFLFDIEAGGILAFASAGVYDDVEQAADAWRKFVGDTGADARPLRVDSAEQLTALAPFIVDERTVMGDESRNLMDNWFRARRRVRDLDAVLTLPRPESPYGVDVEIMAAPFIEWHEETYGTVPNLDAVDGIAEEWMEGQLPETWFAVSPTRVETTLAYMSDWPDENPATIEGKLLLPKWIRWLGANSKLSEELVDRALAVAAKGYVPEWRTAPPAEIQ